MSLFFSDGRIWARMAQVSHRDWPILGGGSVLCTTIPLPPDVSELSERLIRAIDLEGCSMVEYRRDRHGQPVLMEVNPRMGGSVALAIAAGVNFPQLLADWKLGRPLHEVRDYEVGRRLRWLPGDLWHLRSVFASQGQPDVPTRARAVAGFIGDFRRVPTTFDVIELGDLQPAVADIKAMVLQHVKGRLQDMVSITRTDRTAPSGAHRSGRHR